MAARAWAAQKSKAGQSTNRENITFGTYAVPWWTVDCPYCDGRLTRGASITLGYRKVRRSWLENHVLPRFKDVKLSRITTRMIETWVMELRKGKLTATTVNHALRTLKIMVGEAVRLGYLSSDPAKSVRQLKETPEERGILMLEEIRRLFDERTVRKVWDGDWRHYALNMTAASCGLRLGEVLGLTVEHVHPEYRGIVFHSHSHAFNTFCRGKVPEELLRAVVGHRDERMTDRYFHAGL